MGRLVMASVLAVLGLAGCSLLTSLDDLRSGDASTDASTDTAGEEPLPAPKPPCDPSAKPSATGIFVSTTGDDSLAGSASGPVKTLGAAMTLAKAQGAADVYIDEGTYNEAVTIASATTLHGGWKATGATWSKDCSDIAVGMTLIRSPTTQAVAAQGFTGAAGLDTMTLVTKAKGASGESGIAVLVSGTGIAFTMIGVDVTAASGGDGTTPSTPPTAGNTTCNGATCSDGATGAPGPAGAPAAAGSFGATGYVAGSATAGKGGGAGDNGTAGGAGEQGTNCVTTCSSPPNCLAGLPHTASGGTGLCGCAGSGGAAGGAGTSGGASVGVYVFGATLKIDFSTVRAGSGGAGAPGGSGGPGGPGTAGATGQSAFCGGGCVYLSNQCQLTGTPLAGGAAGGHGGPGGVGGAGGGGAGGPSYGVVYAGGATVDITSTTAIQSGAGGKGAGGAPDGASALTFGP